MVDFLNKNKTCLSFNYLRLQLAKAIAWIQNKKGAIWRLSFRYSYEKSFPAHLPKKDLEITSFIISEVPP